MHRITFCSQNLTKCLCTNYIELIQLNQYDPIKINEYDSKQSVVLDPVNSIKPSNSVSHYTQSEPQYSSHIEHGELELLQVPNQQVKILQ